LISQIDTRKTA